MCVCERERERERERETDRERERETERETERTLEHLNFIPVMKLHAEYHVHRHGTKHDS